MSQASPDGENADPFEITTRPEETDGDFVRFEVTVHPGHETEPGYTDLDHEPFLLDNPDEHLHPHQEEIIEVLDGEYAVEIAGSETRLNDGEEITIPEATPHRHYNPSAEPVRVAHEHHPARDSAAHAETMWALAQDGKTDEKGMPNMLRFAVISKAYPEIAYTTAVPIPVQKGMVALLAPLGRLVGYRPEYPLEE